VPEELENLWDTVRGELRREVTDFTFHIWLEPLEPAARVANKLYVRAPRHIEAWVRERYLGVLATASRRVLGPGAEVDVVGQGWTEPEQGEGAAPAPGRELLNPKYTFEQFVIGDGNRLSHAASLAVAELPGQAYNPLFIYGSPGLGKTHLLHAIGNYVQLYGGGLRVCYATVEEFTSEFVGSVRRRETGSFRERFRGADVLLIDDVQFLADKLATTEEFFHTFNALYESGSQLVITSDRAPGDLIEFEARLKERFACGLVADLQPPSFPVRLAILRNRSRLDSLHDVPDATLAEIAGHVTTSVRALEGALVRVVAYASLRGVDASPELAREVLARLYPPRERTCTLVEIQDAVAADFGLKRETLLARDRRPAVALARQIAMFLARELTDKSLPAIGRSFGGRDHATVLHAHRKISAELDDNDETIRRVRGLRDRLSGTA
jgi:chromosomal replication initiator protein